MAVANVDNMSIFKFTNNVDTRRSTLFDLLNYLKTQYEEGISPKKIAQNIFFMEDKLFWNLILEMKDYIPAFSKGGIQTLRFIQNVFAVFDKISMYGNIRIDDLIDGTNLIYKNQIDAKGSNVREEPVGSFVGPEFESRPD